MPNFMPKHAALVALLFLALAGCGDKGDKKTETQVAAKVNGNEVTVHQVNFHVARLGNLKPEQAKAAGNQIVRALVDQQLLVQKAEEAKLDRDPQVMQMLDNARRQILVEVYTDRQTKKVPTATYAEISDYYNKNPALFADRKIFRINEITVGAKPEQVSVVRERLGQAKTFQEFTDWLKSENIPFRSATAVKKAEELPLEMLPRLNAMKGGQTVLMNAGANLVVLQVAASQPQPVTLDQAKTAIERFLANQKRRETMETEIKKLRETAKIEYQGAFGDAGKTEAAPATQAPAAPGESEVSGPGFMDTGPSGIK